MERLSYYYVAHTRLESFYSDEQSVVMGMLRGARDRPSPHPVKIYCPRGLVDLDVPYLYPVDDIRGVDFIASKRLPHDCRPRMTIGHSHQTLSEEYTMLVSWQSPQNTPRGQENQSFSLWSRKLVLFNLDLHISVIRDVQDIFNRLFPDRISITQWSLSGHCFLVNETPADVDIITPHTWRDIGPHLIEQFQTRYHTILETFDGFVVTQTPVFALLFAYLNKPVFIVNSCRFDQPFTTLQGRQWLSQQLKLHKNLVWISNNRGDQGYLDSFGGIRSYYLPSLCLYSPLKYRPREERLVGLYTFHGFSFPVDSPCVRPIRGPFEWNSLEEYEAIIHIPYEGSTMSFNEHYNQNIPLLLPSKSFILHLLHTQSIPWHGGVYGSPEGIPETLTNPEWWVEKADFYHLPHIQYFESSEDLVHLIDTLDFQQIREQMRQYNILRQGQVLSEWRGLLLQHFPKDFHHNMIDVQWTTQEMINTDKMLWISQQHPKTAHFHKTDFLLEEGEWRGQHISSLKDKDITTPKRITGQSDHPITQQVYEQTQGYTIEQWFGINVEFFTPNLIPYPLGITNDCDDSPIHRVLGNLEVLVKVRRQPKQLVNLVYMNFSTWTWSGRQAIHNYFSSKPHITTRNTLQTYEGREQYCKDIRNHLFVLAPRGNGWDTHRLWETIYLGSVPIVQKHPQGMYEAWKNLPILWIDNWGQVNDTLWLQNQYFSILFNQHLHLEKCGMAYWYNRIIPESRKVVSVSLWGTNPRYTEGVKHVVQQVQEIYKDWEMWVYYDEVSVSPELLVELKEYSTLIFKREAELPGAFWRFEAIGNPEVDVVVSRDIDTTISLREYVAVKEWLRSGKGFHIIRDHGEHKTKIIAGMFGVKKGSRAWDTFAKAMRDYPLDDSYGRDQQFLEDIIYPLIRDDVLIHSIDAWRPEEDVCPLPLE